VIATLQRRASVYGTFAAMVPKMFLAYSIWVWMSWLVEIMAMVIFVYFWRAVYAGEQTIASLTLGQTLNYILLARIFAPLGHTTADAISRIGWLNREGNLAIELLRPVDFQLATYISNLAQLGTSLLLQVPLAVVAWLFFGLQLPSDPALWGAFGITLLLGHAALFCFDWIIACLTFYTTEVWGLGVVRWGVGNFLSGVLLPLTMLPDWFQRLAESLPFAQALFAPVSLLSGITPLSAAPNLWLGQMLWLLALGLLSRLVFRVAVRVITVQGG
jgi:ABC-2 type transport system permease protein